MVVTMKQVIALLDREEVDYETASGLGSEALAHLETLVKKDDPTLAPRAAYLASLIQDNRSFSILMIAAKSRIPEVRIAAANSIPNLPVNAGKHILAVLVNDPDYSVRMKALKSRKMMRQQGNEIL